MQLTGNMKTAVLEPLVKQALEKDSSKHEGVVGDYEPKAIPLELAILLLKTWHDEPLKLRKTKVGISGTDSEEARRQAAARLGRRNGEISIASLSYGHRLLPWNMWW